MNVVVEYFWTVVVEYCWTVVVQGLKTSSELEVHACSCGWPFIQESSVSLAQAERTVVVEYSGRTVVVEVSGRIVVVE